MYWIFWKILISTKKKSIFATCSVFSSLFYQKSDLRIVNYITIQVKRSQIWIQSDNWTIRAYFQRQIMLRNHPMKSWRERYPNRVSHTHDQSISRLVNLTERRFHRIVERRYLVTNQAAFRLFALKTLMARSASPCPRNWAPEGLTVAKVNSMPVSLSQIVLAYPEGHSPR